MAGAGFGLAFFGSLFPWLGELGLEAVLPLVVLQTLFPIAFAAWSKKAVSWGHWPWWVAVVTGWGVMEMARERIPLGGFPWGMLGFSLAGHPAGRNASQWIGASGWSSVLVMIAAGLVLIELSRSLWKPLGVGAALGGVLVVAGLVAMHSRSVDEVPVALVQGNEPCLGYHCPGERRQIYQAHLALTRMIEAGSVRLVVWPEGSTGFDADPVLDEVVGAEIGAEARRIGAWLIAGGDRPVSETSWINANVVFSDQGEIVGEYNKRHPVPFGEYIPARPLFDWIPALAAVPRDMIRGDEAKVFDMGFAKVGSVISFEGSFSRYLRETVNQGAQVLVTATSQSSYPESVASAQFIAISQMRAAELGTDIVHVAVTGQSALVAAGGEITAKTPLAEPALELAGVQPRVGARTLYALLGDWTQPVSLATLAWLWWRRRSIEP